MAAHPSGGQQELGAAGNADPCALAVPGSRTSLGGPQQGPDPGKGLCSSQQGWRRVGAHERSQFFSK